MFKGNIMLRLFWSYTGTVSRTFLGLSVLLFLFILFKEFDLLTATEALANGDAFYSKKYYIFWAFAYLLSFIGSFTVLLHMDPDKRALKVQTWIGVIFIVVFIAMILGWVGRSDSTPDSGMATLVGVFIVFMSTGLGWLINTKNSHNKHKISHTFKVLLESRLSSTFQNKLNELQSQYPPSIELDKDDVNLFINDMKSLDDKKKKAIYAAQYILDFYEFIAAGIFSGDLDDDFLYQNARGFVIGMWGKSSHLIRERQKSQPKVWLQLQKLVERWETKYKTDPDKV